MVDVMRPVRALIVDDDPLARERIRQLLRNVPDIELVGACAPGQDAVDALRTLAPEVVLEEGMRWPEALPHERLTALLPALREVLYGETRSPEPLKRLLVKQGCSGRVVVVRMEDLDWIEACGNYVRLHAGNEAYLLRGQLSALATRLDPAKFLRIHRSTIVNIERIQEMQPWFHGDYVVFLHDGTRLTMSRGYRLKVFERTGGGHQDEDEGSAEGERSS